MGERDRRSASKPGFENWRVRLDEKKTQAIWTLRYDVPRFDSAPDAMPRFDIPLIWPERTSKVETTVRVWGQPGHVPGVVGDRWEEQPIKAVADEDSLPDLVLTTASADAPLSLRLREPNPEVQYGVPIERALICAAVAEDGSQSYRASFLIRPRPRSVSLSLELPAPVASLNIRAALWSADDAGNYLSKEINWRTGDDSGPLANSGKTILFELDSESLLRKPAVLELEYQLPPEFTRGSSGLLQSSLVPPLLRGDARRFPVALASLASWKLVATLGEGRAVRRAALGLAGLAAGIRQAEARVELEHGFYPNGVPLRDEAEAAPSIVVTSFALELLRLRHAPQQAWLALCSLGLLVVGLGVYGLAQGRHVFWPALAITGSAALTTALFWPGLLANILYGCEPGALVLLAAAGILLLLQRRYRRQVVFMPSFQRLKTGSSLVRSRNNPPRRVEPSTVDTLPSPGGPEKKDGSTP